MGKDPTITGGSSIAAMIFKLPPQFIAYVEIPTSLCKPDFPYDRTSGKSPA
jgi:hypothetical protein